MWSAVEMIKVGLMASLLIIKSIHLIIAVLDYRNRTQRQCLAKKGAAHRATPQPFIPYKILCTTQQISEVPCEAECWA